MADNPLSPEKQLLNLIEKPSTQKSAASSVVAAVKHQGMGLVDAGAMRGKVSFIKDTFKGGIPGFDMRSWDIKTLNVTFEVIIVVLVLIFLVNLGFSIVHLGKKVQFEVKLAKPSEYKIAQVTSLLKGPAIYAEKARERDIFRLGVRPSESVGLSKGPSQRIIEATVNYRLAGISWSDDPDVMIEDTKNQRTHFLKKGQVIDNEVRVQAVFKDKVILSYQGEEIEIR